MFRRKFIATTGGLAAAGLTAGCLGGDDADGSTTTVPDGSSESSGEATGADESDATQTSEEPALMNESTAGNASKANDAMEVDVPGEVTGDDPRVEVTDQALYRSGGEAYVTGTVENTGEEPIETVKVSVVLKDDADQDIQDYHDTVETEAETARLAPGESWGFHVSFPKPEMSEVASYEVSVTSDAA